MFPLWWLFFAQSLKLNFLFSGISYVPLQVKKKVKRFSYICYTFTIFIAWKPSQNKTCNTRKVYAFAICLANTNENLSTTASVLIWEIYGDSW